MSVQLKIRRLKTGETLVAEFESLEDAETWLRERPAFVDVLGTVSELSPAEDGRLRLAMRPLDEEERAFASKQDRDAEAAARAALEREQAAAKEAMAARAEAAKNADPDRPMHVAWDREQGFSNADEADPRPVPEKVREAVKAWVAERDSWVHPRDQYVATANLVVWPGSIPGGGSEDERIHPGGQFTTLSGMAPELEGE